MAKARTAKTTFRGDPAALGRSFKRRLAKGEVLLGGTVAEYLRPSLVKIYRYAELDFIFVDREHAFLDGKEMSDFVLFARDNKMPVISKISELNRPEVAKLLDAGVVGIQLPRTESRDQLMTLIQYVKFPPLGTRAGALGYGNVDYLPPEDDRAWLKKANQSTVIVAHIETALGYQNAEEIITTPHVDMVYVGPYDFSISMGHPGQSSHPRVKGPMSEILALCRKHNVPFGTSAASPQAGIEWISRGCRFFELDNELSLIQVGAAELAKIYRKR